MRLIREIALSHLPERAHAGLRESAPGRTCRRRLLRLSAHFHPRLPNRDDIRAIVTEEARRYESQSGEKPRGDRQALEMLIMHLLGMEQDDVRRLVRQALRDDGAINRRRRAACTGDQVRGARAAAARSAYEESKVRFDDVGGLARLKHWIGLRRAPFLARWRMTVDRPKGIVLLGVQGGGKSLAARAVAGEWGVPLMRLDFGALYNKYYGETERNLRNAFAAAESMSPCVLWIDEIEKGISTDSGDGDGGVSRRVLGSAADLDGRAQGTGVHGRDRQRHLAVAAGAGPQGTLRRDLLRRLSVPRPRASRSWHPPEEARPRSGKRSTSKDSRGCPKGFSGAEIEQAIVSASFEARARGDALTSTDILAELERTRPLVGRHGGAHRRVARVGVRARRLRRRACGIHRKYVTLTQQWGGLHGAFQGEFRQAGLARPLAMLASSG